ncbi:MAG: radical SAM protein [bacterium]
MKIIKPKEATIAITYRCNLRCSMCNIWQQNTTSELSAEEYKKFPSSIGLVNITGGEPFLRRDIDKIIEILANNNRLRPINKR